MDKKEGKGSEHSNIVHVMSNQYVEIFNYDKSTGQVSYIPENSRSVFTCYDYDLVSLKGIDHLRAVLSGAANSPETHKADFRMNNLISPL